MKSLKRITLWGSGNYLIVQFHPPTLSWEGLSWVFTASVAGTVKKRRGEKKRSGMWPPSDPEMMLSASFDKAEITYCSVCAVAIVSAWGMTEGSKENPSIWCSISPCPSASLCLYWPVSPKASAPQHTLPAHFPAGLCWVLFCRVCLAMHWETISFS